MDGTRGIACADRIDCNTIATSEGGYHSTGAANCRVGPHLNYVQRQLGKTSIASA